MQTVPNVPDCLAAAAACCVCTIVGGGNVLNVQRTVRQLINVGAKGCFLEDQRWPKKTGHLRNKDVISMDEFAAKVGQWLHGSAGAQP
jgi:methylisocitrate lyase